MNDFAEYLEQIVDPTFAEFSRNPGSERHAYLACVAVYHAVDRMAYREQPGLAEEWRERSFEFRLVDIVAHHFKHVKADAEKIDPNTPGIPIGHALGFDRVLGLETRPRPFQSSSPTGSGESMPIKVKRSFRLPNRSPSAATAFNRYLIGGSFAL